MNASESSPPTRATHARRGVVIILLAGFALALYLVVHHGLVHILTTVRTLGWGIVAVVIAHLAQVMFSAAGWKAVSAPLAVVPLWVFVQARLIREAVSALLPLTQIGGEVIATRMMVLSGFKNGPAAGSVIVDLCSEILSQALFTIMGLALLMMAGHRGPIVDLTLIGIVLLLSTAPALLLAQRRGLLRALERLFLKFAARWPVLGSASLEGLHDAIQSALSHPRALLRGFFAHLISWLIGGLEIWLMLHFMGALISPQEALVIESLSQVVRSAAFAVPGALGVQEGGFILLGALYGLAPPMALAVSLVKRVREIILGVPGLWLWQRAENRRGWQTKIKSEMKA